MLTATRIGPWTVLLVGIAVGFVGASFPFVIALLASLPMEKRLPYFFLAYVMGHTGMMLSGSPQA